jgi:molecular chaperone GrpE
MNKKHNNENESPKDDKFKVENNTEKEAKENLALEENEKDKIQILNIEIADLKDKLLRKAAEFENYKRRTENDQLNLLKYAAESFIIKLLPVVDDIERSIQHIEGSKDMDSIKNGMKLIFDKLVKVLDDQGIKKFESKGKPFDVNYHEAVMQRKDDSIPPHSVIDELESGYLYIDKVIRHAKVIVSEDNL